MTTKKNCKIKFVYCCLREREKEKKNKLKL